MNILGQNIDLGAAVFSVAFVSVCAGWPLVVPAILERRRRAKREAEIAAWRKRAAGGRPPMNEADEQDLKRWLADETLPRACMELSETPPETDLASRLGGPAWLPQGMDWPMGRSGRPMIFVAQINFAEAPPLPDFPDSGVVMFFVADTDLWGAYFADENRSDIRVVYVADPAAPGRLELRPGPPVECSPFQSADAETRGGALRFLQVSSMRPSDVDWRIDVKWPGWYARGGDARFRQALNEDEKEFGAVYIGGQPTFTQNDPRSPEQFADYDRVLLQVGSNDAIMWGDVGEACFLIRREDLLARDFSRVLFTWDCH